jgi:hypothetical protein
MNYRVRNYIRDVLVIRGDIAPFLLTDFRQKLNYLDNLVFITDLRKG